MSTDSYVSTMKKDHQQPVVRSLSNDTENDSFNFAVVSDQSTTCSSSDSLSDDEQTQQVQSDHPLKQGRQRPLSLNASGTKFRKLHERSDSGQLRSKLLMKLGIELGGMTVTGSTPIASTEASRVVQKGQEDAFTIALKSDHGHIDHNLQRTKKPIDTLAVVPGNNNSIENKPTTTMKRGRLCFDASVKVHPIPARSDYSKRMRSVMWVSSTELQQNAARNSLEFAAEEWDVSKVVNDEDMILYGGERIHPVHFVQHQMAITSNAGGPPRDW